MRSRQRTAAPARPLSWRRAKHIKQAYYWRVCDAPAEQRVANITTIGKPGDSVMKALIVALALAALIAIPTFAPSATAAPISPSSSSFGSNGY
jgi:hypothetical protein